MPSLFARQNPLDDARNTFSSWDNCMAKSYCKWPVIVGIIVGSLILISIVTCIARCICCGAEIACCCFRCCTCCCSGSGGRSGHKRMKSEPAPYPAPYGAQPPYSAPAPAANPYAQAHAVAPRPSMDTRPVNQQYRSNAMPTYGAVNAPERPQFATFDSTRAVVNEDALPAMPTWKDGRDVHVEVEEAVPEKKGDVELNRLDHNGSMTSGSAAAMSAVGGGGARKSPGSARSPVSPVRDNYGFPPGYQSQSQSQSQNQNQNQSEGFASAVPSRMSPGPQRGMYAQQDEYGRGGSPGANLSPVNNGRGGASYGQHPNQQYGRQSPGQHQAYDSYEQQDHYNQHDQYDDRGQHKQYNHQDYHDDPNDRYNSPAPPPQQQQRQQQDRYNSPGPQPTQHYTDRYNSPAPPVQPINRHNSPQIDYSGPAPPPQPTSRYNSPAPPPQPPQIDYSAPAPPPQQPLPYTPSESTLYELPSAPAQTPSPAPAYPGQRKYGAASPVDNGQTGYQAFQPGAVQGGQGANAKATGRAGDEGFGAY